MTLPAALSVNAWTGNGTPATSPLAPGALGWALGAQGAAPLRLLAPEAEADPRDWRDPRVGWGLVLPDTSGLDDAAKARGEDAPEPLRQLLAARPGSPVLRYVDDPRLRYSHLRRHYAHRGAQDIALSGAERGIADGRLPRYLLIAAGPDAIPWELQYAASQAAAVGRLPLSGQALANYVGALLRDWEGAGASPQRTLVWATDHGGGDISGLMRRTIALPLQEQLAADAELDARLVDGASAGALHDGLADHRPGLVVTTSHGKTGPLADPAAMLRDLGKPVGDDHALLEPEPLLDAWQPDGAVWYAHACCGAGCDAATIFRGLLAPGSPVDALLEGIAALGAQVAPLPLALLGAERPLRAFVGHVEPTFDWTVAHRATGQPLTASIRAALYERLYRPAPVGHALREAYGHVGELYTQRDAAQRAFDRGEPTEDVAMATLLGARDRQAMVVLGDPTVTLPPLPSLQGRTS